MAGGSIESNLRAYGRFTEPLIRAYTKQILCGLKYLHDQSTIHRYAFSISRVDELVSCSLLQLRGVKEVVSCSLSHFETGFLFVLTPSLSLLLFSSIQLGLSLEMQLFLFRRVGGPNILVTKMGAYAGKPLHAKVCFWNIIFSCIVL